MFDFSKAFVLKVFNKAKRQISINQVFKVYNQIQVDKKILYHLTL